MAVVQTLLFTVLLCLGINDPGKQVNDYNLAARALQPDCWWNWGVYDERHFQDPKFVPAFFTLSDSTITQMSGYAKKYPGRSWLLYNEPEGQNGGQANVDPVVAAGFFGKAYAALKAADPTATVLCCGTIISTEGVNWLAKFMAATPTRPDKWHMHLYGGLDPTSWDYYANYQDWWVDNVGGKRNYYLTETCGMWSSDQTALLKYVASVSRPRLERVFWFGAYPEPYVPDWRCNLLNADKSRTALGNIFAGIIAARATPTPTPTRTPTRTPVPTNTVTPVATATATATVTPIGQCPDTSRLQARILELEAQLQGVRIYLPFVEQE